MNKRNFVWKVAEKMEMNPALVGNVINTALEEAKNVLISGDKLMFTYFGTFSVREHGARKGINPRTGEKIDVKPSKSLAFKPSRKLREAINEG